MTEEKQIVGHIICPACGNQTAVKVNKNGCLFCCCTNEINPDTGDKCYHRITWGRAASRQFLKNNDLEILKYGNTGTNDIRAEYSRDAVNDDFERIWNDAY